MKRGVLAIGLLMFSGASVVYSQPQSKEGAFEHLHACYDLAAVLPLPPEREVVLLEQCSKAKRKECEDTRKILAESGKSDPGLKCIGPQ